MVVPVIFNALSVWHVGSGKRILTVGPMCTIVVVVVVVVPVIPEELDEKLVEII